MEAVAVIGHDGPDPSRRAGARDRHIAFIEAAAAEGLLLLGLPIHTPEGRSAGSLMVVPAARLAEYLGREPFMRDGVWARREDRPLRIPALPWPPWPAEGRLSILLAQGVVLPVALADAARAGTLVFAGTSAEDAVFVTTHTAAEDALAWATAALPASRVTHHPTRWRALPYRPLPAG